MASESFKAPAAAVTSSFNVRPTLPTSDNPKSWPKGKKWTITVVASLMTFSATFASSVFSTAERQTAAEFHVSHEVTILGLSLFMLGYCFGPLLWGPLSKSHGRRLPLMLGVIVFCIFQVPVAVAQNIPTIIICRFIGGLFACSPLSIVGAILADIWERVERGIAACIYPGATFSGPVLGPIVGGFVVNSNLGWRWTAWLTLIQGVFFWVLGMVFVPETHALTLLRRFQARECSSDARDELGRANANLPVSYMNWREFMTKYLARSLAYPSINNLYMSLVYGTLYLFFEAYPISFQDQPATTIFRLKRKYNEGGGNVAPEERLVPMMVGAIVLPPGLFWFAWTSSPHITWVPQVLAGIPIGMGIQVIYTMGLNDILDVYTSYAASAVSANTFVRSMAAAGFPLFATPMYDRLGISWATSLLGFVSVLMMPVPILFYVYGERLRKLGRYNVK
ncbi:major facilitator superfamily domain-containing protein [Aspergillus minisclerotigenes]|uniref:Major facilitator superfamily domain-containing protein n=1 Tax=Aspergillus minisclerotigenes TaxID=656917 RepID=A0A5N6J6C6_9EURO|nr:major facilitator superfamily domain-containing protein [Aspergillus minisclerotigenes]